MLTREIFQENKREKKFLLIIDGNYTLRVENFDSFYDLSEDMDFISKYLLVHKIKSTITYQLIMV